ncbi:MAG TPA: hypothetical protein VEI02_08910 [Planctomycetota bacterium]|nr:hypothetical protein [Planctomycetota bacterium]
MKRSLTSLAALALFASAAAAQFQFAATSDISLFEDISVTGGLAIAGATDDSEHNITTTIGNALFPAGPVRIGNNGAAVWGITTGDVGFTNATLPTTGLPTGMPAGGAGYLLPF